MGGLTATRLFGWWWLDSVAALALIPFLLKEGREAIFLFRRGEPLVAVLYALLSVIVGFAAVWLGLKLFSFGTHY